MFQLSTIKNLRNPVGPTTQPMGGLSSGPKINSVVPTSGFAAGGTLVTLTGTGLVDGAKVDVGYAPATAVKWMSSPSISAVPPAKISGGVDVEAVNPDGQKGGLLGEYGHV
jgi:IPT/TIG domain